MQSGRRDLCRFLNWDNSMSRETWIFMKLNSLQRSDGHDLDSFWIDRKMLGCDDMTENHHELPARSWHRPDRVLSGSNHMTGRNLSFHTGWYHACIIPSLASCEGSSSTKSSGQPKRHIVLLPQSPTSSCLPYLYCYLDNLPHFS